MALITYPYNPSGTNAACLILKEPHSLNISTDPNRNYIVPNAAPFFYIGLKVYRKVGTVYTLLTEGVHYRPATKFAGATAALQKEIYGAILLYGFTGAVDIAVDYYTLGANWAMDDVNVVRNLINLGGGPRVVFWDQVKDKPDVFPPGAHEQPIDSFKGFDDQVTATEQMRDAILAQNLDPGMVGVRLTTHTTQPAGSHTPAQVGLGLVVNAPMATNGVAIAGVSTAHYSNPANVKAQIETSRSATATKLHAPFNLSMTGVVQATAMAVDGSGNIVLTTTWAGGVPPGSDVTWSTLPDVPADLYAAKINVSRVPDLPASIIISGQFAVARIPSLPASQITSGVFAQGLIPLLADTQIPTLDINTKTSGILDPTRGGTGAVSIAAAKTAWALDQLPNYPVASTPVANLGTSTATLMTPKLTKDAVATYGAYSAGRLTNPINIALTGDVTGTVTGVDLSGNVSIALVYDLEVPIGKIPDIPATKITGTLGVNHGGTGGTDPASAQLGLGLGSMATYDVAVGTVVPTQRPGVPLIWLIPV